MKSLKLIIFSLIIGYSSHAQYPFTEWEKESTTNKKLLPCYGYLPKTDQEIKADSDFIRQIMLLPEFKTRRDASNHMIKLGFQYYYRPDFKTAMYRFNQAYLLDSTNTDIYWGFGAIYMAFGQYGLAKEQYEIGLRKDSTNTHLLTDLATFYMEQFYTLNDMPKSEFVKDPKSEAKESINQAILYLSKSYRLDPKDVNTAYKLSISYWNNEDCVNAWKFYDEAVALGGRPITKEYTKDLKARCKRN